MFLQDKIQDSAAGPAVLLSGATEYHYREKSPTDKSKEGEDFEPGFYSPQ